MSETAVLDMNGLGDGTLRESEDWLIEKQRRSGITVITTNLNWRSPETAEQQRARIAKRVQILLARAKTKRVVLSSRSASVQLAVAVAQMVDDSRLFVIGNSGRVREGDLAWWDPRTMERCAHLGTDEESRSFYDGVFYCERKVIPTMTQEQKNRIILTTPLFGLDEIVPGCTMPIPGVRNVIMPAIGHAAAIGLGMYRMPKLLEEFPSSSSI